MASQKFIVLLESAEGSGHVGVLYKKEELGGRFTLKKLRVKTIGAETLGEGVIR